MTYASPSRDEFPNRGRWSPAHWADRSPPKIELPVPPIGKDLALPVYRYETKPVIKKVPDLNHYPKAFNIYGYYAGPLIEKEVLEDVETFVGTLKLIPRKEGKTSFVDIYWDEAGWDLELVAIVEGPHPAKVLARAKREAWHLSQEIDDLYEHTLDPPHIIEAGNTWRINRLVSPLHHPLFPIPA